jgi:hypothetical protein
MMDKRGIAHLERVWIILAITVIVIGIFLFLGGRQFVGLAITAPILDSSSYCGNNAFPIGYTGYSSDRGWLCLSDKEYLNCYSENMGYISVVDEEYFRCSKFKEKYVWLACDSKDDGMKGGPGQNEGPYTGEKFNPNYLCYNDKWYSCAKRQDNGDAAEYSISVGKYICSKDHWFAGGSSYGPTGNGEYVYIEFDDDDGEWLEKSIRDAQYVKQSDGYYVKKSSIPFEEQACTSNTISDDGKMFCKSKNWVNCGSGSTNVDGAFLCDDSQWKECEGSDLDPIGGYICVDSKWELCGDIYTCGADDPEIASGVDTIQLKCDQINTKGNINPDNQKYCDGSSWVTCNQNLVKPVPGNEKTLCNQGAYVECKTSPNTKGEYFCDFDKSKWDKCSIGVQSNEAYYCVENKPITCSGSTDDTQYNDIYLCQDSKWKTCSDEDLSVNGHYKCNENVWEKCELNNKISKGMFCNIDTWQKLESSKVAPDLFYWEQAPVPQSDLGNTVQIETQVFANVNLLTTINGICASEEFCTHVAYTGATESNYCYAVDSVYKGLPSQLCMLQDEKAIWLICNTALQEKIQEDGKWLCNQDSKEQLGWIACNRKYDLLSKKFYCDQSVNQWVQCSEEWEDQSSPDGNYACDGSKWSHEVVLGPDNFFEITLGKDENLDVKSPLNDYEGMNICDAPNPPAFSVEVCDDEFTRSINSVQYLAGTSTTIKVEGDIVYVFEQEDPREVSLIYLVDAVATEDPNVVTVDFGTLGQNFEQERRLAIRVYSSEAKDTYQIYLLSHDGANFDFNNLHLNLLPGQVEYENEQLTSDKHQFKIQATKVIIIENMQDGKIQISIGKPQLAIAGQLGDHHLQNEYEVRFDKSNPARLTDIASTELYVCQSDSDLQPKNMQICEANPNLPYITLERDQLVRTTLNGKPVALLYQLVDGKKRASVFWIDDVILNKNGFELSQEFFIQNMVASDLRLAIEFEDNLYLMDHSNGVVDLSSLSLLTYQPFDDPTQGEPIVVYPTESTNEIKVDVPVLGGKVFVEQNFDKPDATIKLTAKTNLQITSEPLNLEEVFSTSMSSQTSVAINNPTEFNIISRSLNDNQIVLNKFKIDVQYNKLEEISLVQKEPQVIDDTLFYYYGSNGLIKGVKIHLLYDLAQGKTVDLTEAYSKSFLGGGELALKFGNSYYLVTHEANSIAFDFPKLQLTELITGESIEITESTTTSTTFQVAEGKVVIYEESDQIYFTKESQDDLITTALGIIDHSFVLTPANKVKLDKVVFDICGTGDAALKKEIVRVCKNGVKLEPMMLVDEQILDDEEDPKYLLWYHGLVSGEKTVTVHTIHELKPGVASEVYHLTENLQALQTKAYLFEDTYFQLAGTPGDFSTYKLYSIPVGEKLGLQQVKKSAYQVENGTYSYNQKLLFAQETWGIDDQGKPTDNITLTLKPLLGKLVTSTGFNVTFTESALIVPEVGEPEYELITQADVDNVKELAEKLPKTVIVAIRDVEDIGNIYYYAKLPLGISTQVLLPHGKVIGIYIEDALGWLEREAKLNGVEVSKLKDEDVGLPQITITK